MRRFLYFIFAVMIAMSASAQGTKPAQKKFDHEAYKAEQHKYILQRVKFTNDEATKFFALLDEMRAKERQLFDKNKRVKFKRPTTDEECAAAILEHDNTDLQRKKIQQLYHRRMLKVIPANKLMNAIFAAEEFDHFKFREMNARMHGNGNVGKDGKTHKGGKHPHGPRPGGTRPDCPPPGVPEACPPQPDVVAP